jgi:hypothetical protein
MMTQAPSDGVRIDANERAELSTYWDNARRRGARALGRDTVRTVGATSRGVTRRRWPPSWDPDRTR